MWNLNLNLYLILSFPVFCWIDLELPKHSQSRKDKLLAYSGFRLFTRKEEKKPNL